MRENGTTVDPWDGLRILEGAKDALYAAFEGQGDSPANAVSTAIVGYRNALTQIDSMVRLAEIIARAGLDAPIDDESTMGPWECCPVCGAPEGHPHREAGDIVNPDRLSAAVQTGGRMTMPCPVGVLIHGLAEMGPATDAESASEDGE